jgi:hypothetical protein
VQANRGETRVLGIFSFVHSTVWKSLFRKVFSMDALIRQLLYLIVAYSYEPELKGDWSLLLLGGRFIRKRHDHEDEYMISEKELIVNKYILFLLFQVCVLVSGLKLDLFCTLRTMVNVVFFYI